MSARTIKARVDVLLAQARGRQVNAVAVPMEPTRPPELESALLEELLRLGHALGRAAKGVAGMPLSPWAFDASHLGVLAGRLRRALVTDIVALARAGERGALLVRQRNGRLAPTDVKAKRQAIAHGRPTYVLPHVPPLEMRGIDVKNELQREAAQGEAA